MKIVCIGDSITAGQGVDPGCAWPAYLPGEVIAKGVNGDTTRRALERFPADVQEQAPDVVVIQFGHNDANRWETDRGLPRVLPTGYRANLAEMVARVRHFDAEPILVTLTRTTKSEQLAIDGADYDASLRAIARTLNVRLADVRPYIFAEHLLDGIHLTEAGHAIYGRVVAAALP